MPPITRHDQDFPEGMAEDIDGQWVKYEDHVAEINRIVEKKSAVEALLKEARDWIDREDHYPDLIGRIDKVLGE